MENHCFHVKQWKNIDENADVRYKTIVLSLERWLTIVRTLHDFSTALTQAQKASAVTAKDLASRTGLSDQAVRAMLHGEAAPRLTNAMALADALGMELVLMPKAAAEGYRRTETSPPTRTVLSDVERRLGVRKLHDEK